MREPNAIPGFWEPFPELETTRLTLRRLTRDDAPRIFQIFGDEETMRYWSCRPYTSMAQAHETIDAMSAATSRGEGIHRGIAFRGDREVTGRCYGSPAPREERGRSASSGATAACLDRPTLVRQ